MATPGLPCNLAAWRSDSASTSRHPGSCSAAQVAPLLDSGGCCDGAAHPFAASTCPRQSSDAGGPTSGGQTSGGQTCLRQRTVRHICHVTVGRHHALPTDPRSGIPPPRDPSDVRGGMPPGDSCTAEPHSTTSPAVPPSAPAAIAHSGSSVPRRCRLELGAAVCCVHVPCTTHARWPRHSPPLRCCMNPDFSMMHYAVLSASMPEQWARIHHCLQPGLLNGGAPWEYGKGATVGPPSAEPQCLFSTAAASLERQPPHSGSIIIIITLVNHTLAPLLCTPLSLFHAVCECALLTSTQHRRR
jgi:hypothetical protein